MQTVNLNTLKKTLFGQENDNEARVSGVFPLSVATGNKSTALVYFELEPGKKVPSHTDTAEEVLLILGGKAEVTIGDETGIAVEGTLAVVPAMEPHSVRNIGKEKVRVVGFFSSNTVMSTFEEPLMPMEQVPAPPNSERTLVTPFPALLEQDVLKN
ncbi:MAG: cupin domain-containing protein [Bacteroidetes bacterium]|nr:cupin domain-containing protein [Bacteroidota bacterium]MCW5894145.1 cupin domain-containing protein [Bacteroidota bacterium]